jgi:hypothetical protein
LRVNHDNYPEKNVEYWGKKPPNLGCSLTCNAHKLVEPCESTVITAQMGE